MLELGQRERKLAGPFLPGGILLEESPCPLESDGKIIDLEAGPEQPFAGLGMPRWVSERSVLDPRHESQPFLLPFLTKE